MAVLAGTGAGDMRPGQCAELDMVRACAQGQVRLGGRPSEYVRNGRPVEGMRVTAIAAALGHGYLALSTDPATGVAARVELTVRGFARVDQLTRGRAVEPV
ncbi:MAG: hypothetical protein ACRDQ7_05990 [Haloechinothrix sp.]